MWERLKQLVLGTPVMPQPVLVQGEPTHVLPPPSATTATVYQYDPRRIQDDQRIGPDLTLRSRYMVPLVMMLLEDRHLTNKQCRERLGKKVRTTYMREARKVVAQADLEGQLRLASTPSVQIAILAREMRRLGLRSVTLTSGGVEVQPILP